MVKVIDESAAMQHGSKDLDRSFPLQPKVQNETPEKWELREPVVVTIAIEFYEILAHRLPQNPKF